MNNKIYAVVAFSRPKFLDNVINNFNHQNYSNKKLIIVENGKAIGECKKRNIQPDILLTSDNHQSYAKNEAIEWIRKHGGGWWSTFDDDDYYGPNYLSKISQSFDKAEIIGHLDLFVRTIAGTIRLFSNLGSEEYTDGVHGSTITARAEDCPLFKNTGKWGEDWKFIDDYIGARCWATDPYHHILCRHNENTWQIPDDSLVRRLDFTSDGKCIIKDFGQENNNTIDIVNNKIKNAPFKLIYPDGELKLEDSQAYIELMKTSKPIEEKIKEWINNRNLN